MALRRWRWEGDEGHGQGCLVTQRCVLSPRRPGDSQALVGCVCVCVWRAGGFGSLCFSLSRFPAFPPQLLPGAAPGLGR